jgi:hypothetical protein
MTEHIIVADEDSTRTITMRRPEKKNTLTQEMYLAMSDAIDSAQSDPAIRCLIITGRSGVFTAGNDISDFLQAATASYDVARPRNAVIFLQSLVNNKKPIIAAVDGIAIGIGTTMVFHCDYVIASTTATLSIALYSIRACPGGRFQPAAAKHGWSPARVLYVGDGAVHERSGRPRGGFRQHGCSSWPCRRRGPKGSERDLCLAGGRRRNRSEAIEAADRGSGPQNRSGRSFFRRANAVAGGYCCIPEFLFA